MKNVADRGSDTIVARATPPGRGGIAVIRVSGRDVPSIAKAMLGKIPKPRYAVLTDFLDECSEAIDKGLALYFPGPDSFTGEDVLELHAHGGPIVCDLLIERVIQLGGRMAEPGEFSRRGFLNDKIDLSQAEAIADLIDSRSRAAARAAQRSLQGEFSSAVLALNERVTELRMHVEAAIDFPDEEIDFLNDDALAKRLDSVIIEFDSLGHILRQGRLLRDGVQIVLAGKPNAGKSSLLNALTGYEAAIVTEIPGTTRDLVRENLDFDGLPIHIIDTAGLRDGAEQIEQEGIRRTRQQLTLADHALIIIDAAANESELTELLAQLPPHLGYTVVRNKIDLTGESPGLTTEQNMINISALTGTGVEFLRLHIERQVGYHSGEGTMTARQRHVDSLEKARRHFEEGHRQLVENGAGELMADELLQVQNALAEITGEFSSDDLLGKIFSSFCIGK
jgi:tRNA modification GTPase